MMLKKWIDYTHILFFKRNLGSKCTETIRMFQMIQSRFSNKKKNKRALRNTKEEKWNIKKRREKVNNLKLEYDKTKKFKYITLKRFLISLWNLYPISSSFIFEKLLCFFDQTHILRFSYYFVVNLSTTDFFMFRSRKM